MESYGSIDERSAATPPKFGRRIIAAVAAVALVVGASVAVSVMPPDRVHRERWHHVPGRPVREVWRRGYDRAAAGVLLPAGPASDSRPRGSLREGHQRPHGLHGPVPEVPERASYDDVLQVLSGVLGPRPLSDRHEGRPPSFSVSIA